ncbi:fumarylacetoacetate hydrolase family protein [Sporosarcina pasteurii]|uniref:4-hydroxyphenylacetate degradation bifunctional isomerase/decarboxylase n=1 Tax=Sporosarcina pasteurii TaxID=1474 RepID=A0A380BFX6_SPOPA|nr:fumarylacetoacetate hydrolase family protein [Sporosarcina pasteurii]MDS9470355.1 fumarylacetoacetate hydrolase family protein [Sporosarcina pasteurii]QBQ05936.1 FAA hydrolase family protein [Sporosarcina pasteurii]SUI99867.1 4-hydroxyphenylacetate degradation bifunctional isomerase/decarboxylase [Sporosarcina pasteurii]
MKLLSFKYNGETLFGPKVKREDAVWDVLALADQYEQTQFPKTIVEGIASGLDFVEKIRKMVERAEQEDNVQYKYAFTEIEWLSPIPRTPKNILCVGKNYLDHATEMGDEAPPEKLMIFTKSPTTIAADEQDLPIHNDVTENLDYEGELAVVIGKEGRNIPTQLAYDHIFGYTIANDITARDIQTAHGQFFLGKSLDESCPMGPYLVTKDEIPNPNDLAIVTKVNDEVRQSSQTDLMIYKIEDILAEVSRFVTLEPGDVILTGTPAGVGKGMNPPAFLKEGDTVKISIEGIGTLSNRFVKV